MQQRLMVHILPLNFCSSLGTTSNLQMSCIFGSAICINVNKCLFFAAEQMIQNLSLKKI
jgi:hypothetical protein